MSFPESHDENDCDKCLKRVGAKNLRMLPYIYKDWDDDKHKDQGNGYRQYYVCPDCWKREERIRRKRHEM